MGRETAGSYVTSNKSQEGWLMMDMVYVAAIIGFFVVCVGYTYAIDRI
jgi:hypothetical protein